MNEIDPLAQLRDIHLPDPVSIWPLALGWWALIVIIIFFAVALTVWLVKRSRQQRYRKTAEALIEQAWQQFENDSDSSAYLTQLIYILRRTAITAYAKSGVQQLHGENWLRFLDSSINFTDGTHINPFTDGAGKSLLTLPYRSSSTHNDAEIKSLHQLVTYWAKHHRPLKRIKNQTNHTPSTPEAIHVAV